MSNPQQQEFRRNARGANTQDNKGPRPGAGARNRGHSTGDTGRPVPEGQVSPYGPTEEPVASDESGRD